MPERYSSFAVLKNIYETFVYQTPGQQSMFRNHEQVILNQLFPKLRRFIFLPLDLSHFLHSHLLNYRTAAMTHRKGFEQRAVSAVLEWPPVLPQK